MKIIITESQLNLALGIMSETINYEKNIFEDIHPSEAYNDYDSLKTVVDGKGDIALIHFIDQQETQAMTKLIGQNKLKLC